jgi:hypothetical protein
MGLIAFYLKRMCIRAKHGPKVYWERSFFEGSTGLPIPTRPRVARSYFSINHFLESLIFGFGRAGIAA